MSNIDYVGADWHYRHNIQMKMLLAQAPLLAETFDVVLCIHVLEHIVEDRKAMHELFRLLKPRGWAGISAPMRLDRTTYEDSKITTPEERKRAFGESVHVRYYGHDLKDRLEESGFEVKMYLGREVDQPTAQKYGLRDDENILYCSKC